MNEWEKGNDTVSGAEKSGFLFQFCFKRRQRLVHGRAANQRINEKANRNAG
jgi:hypothetical protein